MISHRPSSLPVAPDPFPGRGTTDAHDGPRS